ncbi:dTDP-4-dehydrorhamnose reductase [Ammoniphilus sp. 3BR4]|uniref:dTDP-4-dehydrorhamnose reductase n=1 Tax=Ammoniphilus sp. 3BR4 TaxID=3158265 RepID=UPI0034678B72
MKVVVTGAKGQLGTDLVHILTKKHHEVIGFSHAELDITDMDSVFKALTQIKPDAVIHTAAYTKVDEAESKADFAFSVNGFGTRNVVIAAQEVGAKFCYISTDYVFNGNNNRPYQEHDIPSPLSVYGKSKYVGEEYVKTLSSRYFIVRTSWVYGAHGENFVKTMLRFSKERNELGVVHDQTGSPTYAVDLAHFLCSLTQTKNYGIYHATNTGMCTWYEFAKAIFEEAGIPIKLNPIRTEDFPGPAIRPKYSVLDHQSIRSNGWADLRHWRQALKAFMEELRDKNE